MASSKIVMAATAIIMLILGVVIGLVASPIIMPASTAADPVWDNILATGKIRAGTDPSWPPYEQLDNSSKIVGFEVDLADAIAAKLGLTVEWSSVGFDTVIPSIQAKQLDLGVSGFSVTSERLEQVKFTLPHSITRGQVIMLQTKQAALGITIVHSLEELKDLGVVIGTQTGTTEQDELEAAGVDNRAFNDFGAAITDMASTNPSVDAVYAETPITSSWIAQYHLQGKDIVIVYDTPYYPVAFIVNKNANTFLAKIDGALADIIASGQLDVLRAKWNA